MNELNAMMKATHCFAVPGENSIIDMIHPDRGTSWIEGETLDQIRARGPRYADAELMTYADFSAAMVARQDTLIVWTPCTEERHDDMLNVLPPASMRNGGFLVGEPCDHHAGNGQPRYDAFRHWHGVYYSASRPMTRAEFNAQMALSPVSQPVNP